MCEDYGGAGCHLSGVRDLKAAPAGREALDRLDVPDRGVSGERTERRHPRASILWADVNGDQPRVLKA
ncbi:hypothetical protein GCM10010392_11830 [Streptomyces clavifer]|uniref:Uncharacterized protein n=1 Tax=Streptomyces clavifer TaxID=68188 RepID=A0ABS4V1Z3_9ACTN|nr:hypothetical protein [Streptomyces clavifer]GHA87216.1 hypothetical protein GCM10010392_11830 [Streptomyces clavifer]